MHGLSAWQQRCGLALMQKQQGEEIGVQRTNTSSLPRIYEELARKRFAAWLYPFLGPEAVSCLNLLAGWGGGGSHLSLVEVCSVVFVFCFV